MNSICMDIIVSDQTICISYILEWKTRKAHFNTHKLKSLALKAEDRSRKEQKLEKKFYQNRKARVASKINNRFLQVCLYFRRSFPTFHCSNNFRRANTMKLENQFQENSYMKKSITDKIMYVT